MLNSCHNPANYWGEVLTFSCQRSARRWLLLFSIFLLAQGSLLSQSNMVLYNMPYVPQSHQLNPGQMPYMKWHVGVPALSNLRFGLGSTGFDFNRINAQIEADEATYSTIISPTAPEFNRGVLDFEIQLLNFGFQFNRGQSYLSFDLADAFYTTANYTKDMARMFDQIESNSIQGAGLRSFDQSKQNLHLAYYRSYGIGFSQQVDPKLSLGIRVRYLQGILSLQSQNQDFRFQYPGEGTTFNIQGQLQVMTAGRSLVDEVDGLSSLFPAGNGGLAIDLGGLYRINDQWEVSFALQQLGQITWKQDLNYTTIDNRFAFSAVDIDDHMDTWSAVADSLLDGQGANTGERFTTTLPQRYFVGVNYFFAPNSSVGLLLNPINYYQATDLNLALSLQTRLGKILGISAVFGHTPYADFNVGTGLSIELGSFQVYALTEALFSTPNWRSAEFGQAQLGLNFNFGRYKRSKVVVAEERENIAEVDLVKPTTTKKRRRAARLEQVVEDDLQSSRPVKTAPAKEASIPASAEPLRLAYVSPAYYLFTASIADLQTGLRVERAKYEVYTLATNGEKQLLLIGSVLDGTLSVQLAVEQLHVVKLIAQGYQEQEVVLRKVDKTKSQTEIQSGIKLVPKQEPLVPQSVHSAANPPEDSLQNQSEAQSQEPPPTEDAVPVIPPSSIIETSDTSALTASPETSVVALPQYRLTRSTSLRQEATHTSGIILRLKTDDQVEVLEKTTMNWWKVRFRQKEGYAKAALLAEL